MVAKPIKLCEIALYSLNYFCSMTNKKKGANQLSFTANCLLGKTTVTGIRELEPVSYTHLTLPTSDLV